LGTEGVFGSEKSGKTGWLLSCRFFI